MEKQVRAAGLRGLVEIAESYDLPILPLLESVGLSARALEDEDSRISLSAAAELLELASVAMGCPDLGLRIAKKQDISILGPLAIAMENASTIREAVEVGVNFLHTHSNGIHLSVHEKPASHTHLRLFVTLPNWQKREQLLELCLADLYHIVAFLAQATIPVVAITFPHPPTTALSHYEAYFKHPVDFEQTYAELILPQEFLERPLLDAKPQLHQLSLKYLALAYHKASETTANQVEAILTKALSSTDGKRDVVANLMHLHPRTLQRRLKAEGTSFSDILTHVRKKQAKYWLQETSVPLAHVADILGFSDQAVLSRSCKKWFGLTPKQVRYRR